MKFILFLCAAFTVFPTSMFQVGLKQLSTEAEQIVQATVTSIVVMFNRDSTEIHTYIRMNIKDDLVGAQEDNEIIVKQLGGRVGTLTMGVEGTSVYKTGEENVLFLFKDPFNNDSYQTLGMYQGRYRVFTGTDNIRRVQRDTTGHATLYKSLAGTAPAVTGDGMSLDDFKMTVQTLRTGN